MSNPPPVKYFKLCDTYKIERRPPLPKPANRLPRIMWDVEAEMDWKRQQINLNNSYFFEYFSGLGAIPIKSIILKHLKDYIYAENYKWYGV